MGQLFGKPKPKSRITNEDKAILQLKLERDNLVMTQKRYEKNMEREKQLAKELLHKGQKDRALLMLKKKRLEESNIARIDKHLAKIEQMVSDIEMAQMNKNVLENLYEGSRALQTINKAFSIDEIEKIMLDTQEATEYQSEISSLLAGQLTEEELESAEQEFDEMFHVELPEAPDHELEDVKEAGRLPLKKSKDWTKLEHCSDSDFDQKTTLLRRLLRLGRLSERAEWTTLLVELQQEATILALIRAFLEETRERIAVEAS